jgi:AraC-like DNA-binding protein
MMTYYEQQVLRIRDQHYPKPYQTDRVVQAKHFIDKHAASNITLEDIAAHSCLSKFHFIRLFKKCYGTTPHQYLTEIKLVKAKQLLQSGTSVSATCFLLGFTSTTSFTGLFKKNTGLAPLYYLRRKKQL